MLSPIGFQSIAFGSIQKLSDFPHHVGSRPHAILTREPRYLSLAADGSRKSFASVVGSWQYLIMPLSVYQI